MGTITWIFAAVNLLAVIGSCHAATLESVHWSSSNSKFTAGQGLVLYPQIGDKMDIVCPRMDPSKGGREEFYRVYLVTRSQMESCTIDKADTPLLNCDKPGQDVKFTFKFQEFSPNLWGLEFLKGRDYYITTTSTGSLQSLDNTEGGVCRTKSMKLLLRVGQSPSDPDATLKESPTRFPPTRKKPKVNKLPSANEESVKSKTDAASETGQNNPSGSGGSEPRLFIWVVAGCAILLLIIVVVVLILWKCRRRHCIPDNQHSTSVSLSTLAVPKRDSISSDNNGSDRSDVVFPLRPSESMICRHFDRVSSDYGPPVYIVQEITPQTPTNIYYKV